MDNMATKRPSLTSQMSGSSAGSARSSLVAEGLSSLVAGGLISTAAITPFGCNCNMDTLCRNKLRRNLRIQRPHQLKTSIPRKHAYLSKVTTHLLMIERDNCTGDEYQHEEEDQSRRGRDAEEPLLPRIVGDGTLRRAVRRNNERGHHTCGCIGMASRFNMSEFSTTETRLDQKASTSGLWWRKSV